MKFWYVYYQKRIIDYRAERKHHTIVVLISIVKKSDVWEFCLEPKLVEKNGTDSIRLSADGAFKSKHPGSTNVHVATSSNKLSLGPRQALLTGISRIFSS